MSTLDVASKSFLDSDVINDEFFIEIVEQKLNISRNKFKLCLVYIAPATGSNENFASVVYRGKISIEILDTKEKKLVDVIIKALIVKMQKLKDLEVFKREIIMYNDVIGSFEEIYMETVAEKIQFSPKCVKIMSDPYEIIVLDDLKAEGYGMADRKVGLDLEHAQLVLTKLAKFHAAGAVRFQKDGMINEYLDRVAVAKKSTLQSAGQVNQSYTAFLAIHKRFTKLVRSIEGYEKIADKIQQWDVMKMLQVFISVTEPMQNGFKVLSHGDDWVNNFMFKYDENEKPLDVKFIDFQLSFWGSPANDLIYFLVSSVKDEVKIEYFDDLIQYYHDELVSSLKKLNYDQPFPTLYELHVDLLQKGGAFAFHMMLILLIVKNNSDQVIDLPKLFSRAEGEANPLEEAACNPIYIKAVAKLLPFFNKRGYLDAFLPQTPLTPFMKVVTAMFQKMRENATPEAAD